MFTTISTPPRPALQEQVAPDGTCFGCGCAHPSGLHLKSYWDETDQFVIARKQPAPEFIGWPGLVYGGYLAMLVDCHSNWTNMAFHYRAEGLELGSQPRIESVTGQLHLSYCKPTPMGVELYLKAWVDGEVARKSRVICEIWADNQLTVTADSTFVRVNAAELANIQAKVCM